ncbi:PhzF family phenazine biosynthesis protein [Mesorhizobium sp. UC22_110]|uniref:PhzF family phenazine biosynthesis protein n=1 Tax=Mesorhizobium sp. UC22_110 TaxID=3374552 RepID=UPI003756D00A
MSLPFAIIDVFAASPLEGNPLAVVDGGDELPDDRLAAIAGEFNLVETTFVMRATHPDATLRLRSFTAAGHEVFGAGGHNSLGAWLWLAQSGRLEFARSPNGLHTGDRRAALSPVDRRDTRSVYPCHDGAIPRQMGKPGERLRELGGFVWLSA